MIDFLFTTQLFLYIVWMSFESATQKGVKNNVKAKKKKVTIFEVTQNTCERCLYFCKIAGQLAQVISKINSNAILEYYGIYKNDVLVFCFFMAP